MEKLSRTILNLNLRSMMVPYEEILPIIQRLAEYEALEMTPQEVDGLRVRHQKLKEKYEEKVKELNNCVEKTRRRKEQYNQLQDKYNTLVQSKVGEIEMDVEDICQKISDIELETAFRAAFDAGVKCGRCLR